MQWLKQRPQEAAPIQSLDWRQEKSIGDVPKNIEYLIIDAPGALSGEHAEQLISEAHAIITPLQPSFFDIDSTRRFGNIYRDIKRIRKGKNRFYCWLTAWKQTLPVPKIFRIFSKKLNKQPVAWISERAAYAQLAMQGLSIFDKTQKTIGLCKINGNRC